MAKSKLVTDKDFDKEVRTDGVDYKTPKDQRGWSYNYYHKNKDQIADNRRHRFMTDPEFRARVIKQKKANERKKAARELARSKGIAPYLLKVNEELVLVNMCAIVGLAALLERSKATLRNWIMEDIIPYPMYRNRANHRLFTEMQALYIKEIMDNNMSFNKVGVDRKILKEKTHEHWKKYPWGFDLDDLEFEEEG